MCHTLRRLNFLHKKINLQSLRQKLVKIHLFQKQSKILIGKTLSKYTSFKQSVGKREGDLKYKCHTQSGLIFSTRTLADRDDRPLDMVLLQFLEIHCTLAENFSALIPHHAVDHYGQMISKMFKNETISDTEYKNYTR